MEMYCYHECIYLNPKEREENTKGFGHICKRHGEPVKHVRNHPKLLRISKCLIASRIAIKEGQRWRIVNPESGSVTKSGDIVNVGKRREDGRTFHMSVEVDDPYNPGERLIGIGHVQEDSDLDKFAELVEEAQL